MRYAIYAIIVVHCSACAVTPSRENVAPSGDTVAAQEHSEGPRTFQGSILFDVKTEMLVPGVDAGLYGTQWRYHLAADGDIRWDFLDSLAEWEIYDFQSDRCFTLMRSDRSTLYCDSYAGAEDRTILSSHISSTNERILGRRVDHLLVKWDDGSSSEFWFDPELHVDTSGFVGDGERYYWDLISAPALRYRTTGPVRIGTRTAIEIDFEPALPDLFVVPDMPKLHFSEYVWPD